MFISDRLQISTERQYTDEGFLIVPARISRIGIQEYTALEMGISDSEPNKMVRVLRPKEEVFKSESLSSFQNKPITNNHPPELVNAKNSKEYSVGHAGPEVLEDGMFVKTMLFVTDEEAIKNIESGKVELSNGYTADIDWTSGISEDGENFDAVQRNIKGNHVALVERGRAGTACRVADNLPTSGEKIIMAKITIDGVDFEVPDQAVQAVNKLQARLTDAEEKTKEDEEEMKKKEDEMEEAKKESEKTEDSLKSQLKDATSKIPNAKSLDKLVADRVAIVEDAKLVSPEIVWEGKDSADLMKEVVLSKRPNVQLDSQSDEYIRASFDIMVDQAKQDPQFAIDEALKTTLVDGKPVDNRSPSVIARDAAGERNRNKWKTGGAK